MIEKTDKAFRHLQLHERLCRGEPIVKNNVIAEFGVNDKTFQRDINSLKQYCYEYGVGELRTQNHKVKPVAQIELP